jgi:hypothetical protein
VPALAPRRLAASEPATGPPAATLRDLLDRPAVPPAAIATFHRRGRRHHPAPILAAVFAIRGPCLYADLTADEPLALDLVAGRSHDLAVTGGGPVRLGLRLADPALAPGARSPAC